MSDVATESSTAAGADDGLLTPVATAVLPPWAISVELLRELALKINPFVAVGTTVPLNVRATGWLADVVDKDGWDEAFAKYPETAKFLERLLSTVEWLAALGVEAAEG